MNKTRRSQSTIEINHTGLNPVLAAILTAGLLMFFAVGSARAAETSPASGADEQRTVGLTEPTPKPELTPDKVVRIQLNALAQNNTPYPDAGIEIAFRFASPANKQTTGPLNRFIQLVHNPAYKPMLNHQKARFGQIVIEDVQAYLAVYLTASDGKRVGYMFILSKQIGGAYDQCWMTDAVFEIKVTSA